MRSVRPRRNPAFNSRTWHLDVTCTDSSGPPRLLVPLQDRLDGAPRSYWPTKMTCLSDAFEDWDVDVSFEFA